MQNSPTLGHISICICTYKRPALLIRLLTGLEALVTDGLFTYSVIVVDNDHAASARDVVARFTAGSTLAIAYHMESEQNIAVARNRAIAEASGEFIALIDDDEFPNNDWLLLMYRTLRAFEAQGVLGPVKPYFEITPPTWLVKGGFCERPSYPTGTVLREPRQTRTGNCLLRRAIFRDIAPFDPQFGRSGGEDVDFFERRLRDGDRFVWCDEAPVFESVPSERMTRAYILKRAILRGVANAERTPLLSIGFAKSLVASVVYSAILPVLLPRHDVFMRYLVRDFDHIGKIFAMFGIRLVHRRDEG
jgi:succinoglycan biosynthesis protein ExoM